MIICDKGSRLVSLLDKKDIPARVIGKTTLDKAKIVWNQEEKRYLDRPAGDSNINIREEDAIKEVRKR